MCFGKGRRGKYRKALIYKGSANCTLRGSDGITRILQVELGGVTSTMLSTGFQIKASLTDGCPSFAWLHLAKGSPAPHWLIDSLVELLFLTNYILLFAMQIWRLVHKRTELSSLKRMRSSRSTPAMPIYERQRLLLILIPDKVSLQLSLFPWLSVRHVRHQQHG